MWHEAFKNHLKVLLLSSSISISTMFQLGYIASYPNTAYRHFQSFVNNSYIQRGFAPISIPFFSWFWSFIINVPFIGLLIGVWISSNINDRFGRKSGLLTSSLINLFGTFFSVLSIYLNQPFILAIGRFLSGFGDGIGATSLTLFLQESAPTKIRGLISGFQELSVCISTLIGMIIGLEAILGRHLIVLIGISSLSNLILILILFFCPDTPKFLLLSKQSENDAIAALNFYHGNEDEAEIRRILHDFRKEDDKTQLKTSLKQVRQNEHLRKAAIIGCVAFSLQVLTGIYPTTTFSTIFFHKAGMNEFQSNLGAVVMMLCNCLATIISMNFIDRFGRRLILLVCGSLNVAALISYTISAALSNAFNAAKYGCLLSMFAFSFTFSLGVGPVPWFLTAELVPHHQRSFVQSLAYSVKVIFALLTGTLTLPLYNYIGGYSFIPLFILPSIACLVYLNFELPETQNREIHEIVADLKGGKRNNFKRILLRNLGKIDSR